MSGQSDVAGRTATTSGPSELIVDVECESNGTDDFFPSKKHHRQESLMEEVRDRIEKLPEIAPIHGKLGLQGDVHTHRAATLAAISASLSVPELSVRKKAVEPKFQVSFRTALVGTIVVAVLLSCVGMVVPLEITRMRLSSEAYQEQIKVANEEQEEQLNGLFSEAFFSLVMAGVSDFIGSEIKARAEGTVDWLLGVLQPSPPGEAHCTRSTILTNRSGLLTPCVQWSHASGCNVWAAATAHGVAGCGWPQLTPSLGVRRRDTVGIDHLANSTEDRQWSEVWAANGALHMTWVAPAGDTGDATPSSLHVAAVVDLNDVSSTCQRHWDEARRRLFGAKSRAAIGENNSNVFVVNQLSLDFPDQQGLLIGCAHACSNHSGIIKSTESLDATVRYAAHAVQLHFQEWNATALQSEQTFTFNVKAMQSHGYSEFAPCDFDVMTRGESNCALVATRSVVIDARTRWLVVAVLPGNGRAGLVVHRAESGTVRSGAVWPGGARGGLSAGLADEVWLPSAAIFVGVVVLSLGLALGLGCAVSRPLRQLDDLMRQLGDFDFSRESAEAQLSRRSSIAEVSSLQRTLSHLSHATEAFARFVPETVVRRIVRGDPRAARLHVSRRVVTIMFSDIRDFTAISETLPECDLLFILTRYLSVMTRIVEYFNGIVAEVLGDGLLVFWNTPDDVSDHAAKGCQAALAQQQAMIYLNAEFARLKLPQLAIRIGLHTGPVLSGNLGSEMKMKFGCLGDPINLASRLEGLCKIYGVGVLCSGSTHDALPPEYGFFCRKLDLVQVKGKREATWIYEVIGLEPYAGSDSSTSAADGTNIATSRAVFCKASSTAALDAIHKSTLSLCRSASSIDCGVDIACNFDEVWPPATDPPLDSISPNQRALVQLYEKALGAYQEARFHAARDLASALLEKHPDDVATCRLLERIGQYISADDNHTFGLSDAERASWTGVFVMKDK
mmetsp:Transcript_33419/g.92489  ORF Transcript_33419/g.92489 Transcript_33419/m.92489 type:complete len:957 (-) Transcript_33419:107-2977(-)|eukprot:CAMPEP_0179023732 /NCGR_PEP_ID=MMETSP0796-20121207/7084_1 /TAXON_ID=73915 /ORGANISM="Pyrodinium bahamense, Strain pbaha01" /LENGTH=956 /DNA_ID=CAMNT_0020719657 /DNA_START=80 /DNA_END=2950 /DNA_ORIENTATION=-